MLIVNPVAHNLPSPKRLAEAEEWLAGAGWQVERRDTERPGHATALAREARGRGMALAFVCGGDGTLNEAANGLAGGETALACIRAGTVNILGRELKVPRRPLKAVRAAVEGERRLIDLGRAGERYFLLMAGYGLDGAIAHRVSVGLKGRLGAAAYALASLRELFRHKGVRVALTFDGEREEAEVLMLVAGNTRNYAGLVEITREALVDDGLLDVCVYSGRGTLDILLHALRTLLRRHTKSKKVTYRKVRWLEMEWAERPDVQLDGDAYPEAPATLEVAPGALWVAVPKEGLSSPLFRARD
jgi:YegS/Rv2252/BmrU family lipid kinase